MFLKKKSKLGLVKYKFRKVLISKVKSIANIKLLVRCFPFIFAISKVYYSKYQDETFQNVFRTNLPGISLLHVDTSWPTFEQVFSDQLEVEPNTETNGCNSSIKRVDFYTDSVLIQPTSNWYAKQRQFYLGLFHDLKLNNDNCQIGNNWYSVSNSTTEPADCNLNKTAKNLWQLKNENKSNFLSATRKTWNSNYNAKSNTLINSRFFTRGKYYSNLDELPLKLNSNYTSKHLFYTEISLTKFSFNEKNLSPYFRNETKKISSKQNLNFSSIKPLCFEKVFESVKSQQNLTKILKRKIKIKISACHNNEFPLKKITTWVTTPVNNDIETDLTEKENFSDFPNLDWLVAYEPASIDDCKPMLSEKKEKVNLKSDVKRKSKRRNLSNSLVGKQLTKAELDLLVKSIFEKKWFSFGASQAKGYGKVVNLLEFMNEISTFYEDSVTDPCVMSGYSFPDSTTQKNLSLLTQFVYKKNVKLLDSIFSYSRKLLWEPILEISLPKHVSYSEDSLNNKFENLQYDVETHKVNYPLFTEGRGVFLYKGPSIQEDKTTNELNFLNQESINQWLQQACGSDSILSDRRETFFGKNVESDELTKNLVAKRKSKLVRKTQKVRRVNRKAANLPGFKKNAMQHRSALIPRAHSIKLPLLKRGKTISIFEAPLKSLETPLMKVVRGEINTTYEEMISPNSLFADKEYPYVVYLDEKEWTSFFATFSVDIDFPITMVEYPTKNSMHWCLNQLEFNNFLFEKKVGNVPTRHHYFPYLQNCKQLKNSGFANIHKKNPTSYGIDKNVSTNPRAKFYNLYYRYVEPITSDSWLLMGQFSIALFIIQICKTTLAGTFGEVSIIGGRLKKTAMAGGPHPSLNIKMENFRVIKNIKKLLRDIAGIDDILAELSEIVWFLRNSGRPFKIGNTVPRRILLTGPPGTGKTLLVQAIGGESEVPVLIQSGSSLTGRSQIGSRQVEKLFTEARKIAPCIIFIDEIDSFGEARNQMAKNSNRNNSILDFLYPKNGETPNTFQSENSDFFPRARFSADSANQALDLPKSENDSLNPTTPDNENTQKFSSQSKAPNENVLRQLLIELDGISTDKKIVVFAATNRPATLDTALTRPGRFNKVFHLGLPNKQKRIEILKLYSKNLGIDTTVSWNYLANLTPGLSAADLASVMNQSSLRAIQNETIHSIETIEYGIEYITGYTTQKNTLKAFTRVKNNKKKSKLSNQKSDLRILFINRLAYYQAGKALVQSLLKHHPQVVSVHLWPQTPRYHFVNSFIGKEVLQIRTRIQLESRIIGFYGGKASELLSLFHGFKNLKFNLKNQKTTRKSHNLQPDSQRGSQINSFLYLWQSDLGRHDLNFAAWLAQLMITKWYFYSTRILTAKFSKSLFSENSNSETIFDPDMLEVFKNLANQTENETIQDFVEENYQNPIRKRWLQKQITTKIQNQYPNKENWYNLFEADRSKHESTRYFLPDNYYHNNNALKNLLKTKSYYRHSESQPHFFFKSALTWNNATDSSRDYIFHSLVLTCFNKAIAILDINRELLDFFASCLIQKEILREYEIDTILKSFRKNQMNSNSFDSQFFSSQTKKPTDVVTPLDFDFYDSFAPKRQKNDNGKTLENKNQYKVKTKILQKTRTKPSRFIDFNSI